MCTLPVGLDRSPTSGCAEYGKFDLSRGPAEVWGLLGVLGLGLPNAVLFAVGVCAFLAEFGLGMGTRGLCNCKSSISSRRVRRGDFDFERSDVLCCSL